MSKGDLAIACGIAAPLVLAGAVLIATAHARGYDSMSETVSRLSARGAPHAWIVMTGLIVFGVLTVVFGGGLAAALRTGVARWLVAAGLAAFGAGAFAAGIARDYGPNDSLGRWTEGGVHTLAVRVGIYGILAAVAAFIVAATGRPRWRGVAVFSLLALIFMAATGLSYMRAPLDVRGLVERTALLIAGIWMIAVAAVALRLRHRDPCPRPRRRRRMASAPERVLEKIDDETA